VRNGERERERERKNDLGILTDLHVLRPLIIRTWFSMSSGGRSVILMALTSTVILGFESGGNYDRILRCLSVYIVTCYGCVTNNNGFWIG
jgi:hypothetical protein